MLPPLPLLLLLLSVPLPLPKAYCFSAARIRLSNDEMGGNDIFLARLNFSADEGSWYLSKEYECGDVETEFVVEVVVAVLLLLLLLPALGGRVDGSV